LKGARPDFAGARAQHVALAERQIGILVDAVSDILNIAPREMLPVPEMNGGMIQSFLSGLVSREDHLVALLRLEDLFAIGALSAPRHSWMGPGRGRGKAGARLNDNPLLDRLAKLGGSEIFLHPGRCSIRSRQIRSRQCARRQKAHASA
jgi:hypothetical protein